MSDEISWISAMTVDTPVACTDSAVYDFACSDFGIVLGQGGNGTGSLGHEDNDGDGSCDCCGSGM